MLKGRQRIVRYNIVFVSDTQSEMCKATFLITLLFVLSTDHAQAIGARSAEAPITDEPSAERGTVWIGEEGEILIYTKNDIFICV